MLRSVLLFAAFLGLADLAIAADYTFTDLGNLSNGTQTVAYGINARGQVVGGSNYGEGFRAFLWTPATPNGTAGAMVPIGPPDGGISVAYGINASGQVTGVSDTGLISHAFIWNPSTPNGNTGSMHDLGDLPGGADLSYGNAINDFGQVVGRSGGLNPFSAHAFLWTPSSPNSSSGAMIDLGVLDDFHSSTANSINNLGQVVGSSNDNSFRTRAFLWTPATPNGTAGTMLDMSHEVHADIDSSAHGINDAGQISGQREGQAGDPAFVWTPDSPNGLTGSSIDLAGGSDQLSTGSDINALGHIVGIDQRAAPFGAFVWTPADGFRNLNALHDADTSKWKLQTAFSINDYGQIVGEARYYADGYGNGGFVTRAFLLTPIPEPSGLFACVLLYGATGRQICRRLKRSTSFV